MKLDEIVVAHEPEPLLADIIRDLLSKGQTVISRLPRHKGIIWDVDDKARVRMRNVTATHTVEDWIWLVASDDHELELKKEVNGWALSVKPGEGWST